MLSGIDIRNVDGLNSALERAARTLVQKADVPEASGVQNIVLYNGVYNYACNPNIFGTAVVDLRPQGVNRPINDFVYKKPQEQFDRTKGWLPNGTMITFEYSNGQPIIRVESTLTIQRLVVDNMTEISGWVAGGTASNLVLDNAVYYQQPASLRYIITGLGTGTLTKTLTNAIDASSYQGVGVAFLAIQIPSGTAATDVATISLKLGSDSGNYSLVTESEGFLGAWVSGEWLLVAFDFAGASNAGTPDWSAIDYVQVLVGTLATVTNFRVGGLWISQPCPAQLLYQSAAIFKAGTAVASTTITSNDDTIILTDAAYTLYEYESTLAVMQQTGGAKNDSMTARINGIINGEGNTIGLYDHYRGDNPSEELRTIGSYYDDDSWGGQLSR